jgi:Bacterial AMP nucleoside phosphorylase N-terminus
MAWRSKAFIPANTSLFRQFGLREMHPVPNVLAPNGIATEAFTDAAAAVTRLQEIYERNTRFLRERFEAFANGKTPTMRVRATYPFVRITTSTHSRLDSRLSYGFVAGPGVHEATVTRPDLFQDYLTEQIRLLIENHGGAVEIGESGEPIPIHFAYRRDINIEPPGAFTYPPTPLGQTQRFLASAHLMDGAISPHRRGAAETPKDDLIVARLPHTVAQPFS